MNNFLKEVSPKEIHMISKHRKRCLHSMLTQIDIFRAMRHNYTQKSRKLKIENAGMAVYGKKLGMVQIFESKVW